MTLTYAHTSPPLAKQIKAVAFGLIASIAFATTATTTFAGSTEIKLLVAKLGGSGSDTSVIAAASAQDLAAAVTAVITDNAAYSGNPSKAGIVAGEALKYNQDPQSGEQVGQAVKTLPAFTAGSETFVAITGKTAGTGKGLNVDQIPDFSVAALDLNATPDSIRTAKETAVLSKNKGAQGAILGGQASVLANDSDRITLANTSVGDSKLKAAVQDIARYVGAASTDSAAFVLGFASAQPASAVKIAIGVASGVPTQAGAQADLLYKTINTTLKEALVKGVATFAKSVSLVSDIEQIPVIANVLSRQINDGSVKLSKATGLLKTLVKSVVTAPVASATVNTNIALNRKDEAAEVAAFFVGGLTGALDATNAAKTAKTLLTWIKGAVKSFKGGANFLPADIAADLTASVALTIQNAALANNSLQGIADELKLLLYTGTKAANNQKGIEKNSVAAIQAALTDVYGNMNLNNYEDGTLDPTSMIDPETDFRPYSV